MPFVILSAEESFTPTHRLNFDSTRSPAVPTVAATTPNRRALPTAKWVYGMNAHDTMQEKMTDPSIPSQLFPGDMEGHNLWFPPFISFADDIPKANPPTSENLMIATM